MRSTAEIDFQVCHRTEGRIRLRVPFLWNNPSRSFQLERLLIRNAIFTSVRVRPTTGCVILGYNQDLAGTHDVLYALGKNLDDLRSMPPRDLIPDEPPPGHRNSSTVRHELLHVLALTGFSLFYLFRLFVTKSPLSPTVGFIGVALGSLPLFRRAFSDVAHGKFLSANTFLSGATVLSAATREIPAALEVIWIQEIGQFLEGAVQDRSRRAIRDVLVTTPENAHVLAGGSEIVTPIDQVRHGDVLAVHEMERVPVDGVILKGEALMDESHITGRAEPVPRTVGDRVFAGTMLNEGALKLRAEKVGADTYLARVTRMVETSLLQKAEVEGQADRLAARLTALGLGASAAVFLLTGNLARALSLQLALASPCATVLAASTAVTSALAAAARRQVLIKAGKYLERMASADCICFDKTGTLTDALPHVVEVIPALEGENRHHVLHAAAEAQGHSTHPIARALRKADLFPESGRREVLRCETFLGRGVRSRINGDTLAVGNAEFMVEEGTDFTAFSASARRLAQGGCTLVYVAQNRKALGIVGLKYGLKDGSAALIQRLRSSGVSEIHLISGDDQAVVRRTARGMGLTHARGNMLPENKASYVERLVRRGRVVVMVGDGINDAPALARADVGIAMGAGGAEAAVEAADIALADDRLDRLVFARDLSRQTLRIIAQNHWFALTTDLVNGLLAVAGILPPVLSGGFHIAHTILILANSSRLLAFSDGVEVHRQPGS